MSGRLVILSGPSGVGKDTVIDAWREADPTVQRVVAYTTRKPRPSDVDGVDYHFVPVPEFERMAAEGAFLEYKLVHRNYYGTPIADMERMLAEGKVAVLKIDVEGAKEAMAKRPDAITVFIMPPSREELERRIRDRGTEDEDAILVRLNDALHELEAAPHYTHRLVNEDVQAVVTALQAITAKA